MNKEHTTFKIQDHTLRRLLATIKKDIDEYGVETAYELLHARNQTLIIKQQQKTSMDIEESIAAVAMFGALQYIEGLFLNGEIEDAVKIS